MSHHLLRLSLFALLSTVFYQEGRSFLADVPAIDAVSAATSQRVSVIAVLKAGDDLLEQPAAADAPLTSAQIEDLVSKAIYLSGGIHKYIDPGSEWILLKPDVAALDTSGSGRVTDVRVVKGVIEVVHQAAPQAQISIVEGPTQWISPGQEIDKEKAGSAEVADGFERAGYRALLADPALADIELDIIDLNFAAAEEIDVPDSSEVANAYFVPIELLECDMLISIPVFKGGVADGMESLKTIAPGPHYGWDRSALPTRADKPGGTLIDLALLVEADFAVMDMLAEHRAIVAGRDLVAVDATAARMVALKPEESPIHQLGYARRIGQFHSDWLKVVTAESFKKAEE